MEDIAGSFNFLRASFAPYIKKFTVEVYIQFSWIEYILEDGAKLTTGITLPGDSLSNSSIFM